MTGIFDLPSEIVEKALLCCDPLDVAAFAQSCQVIRALIYQAPDQHLWRQLYLTQPFDDPRQCVSQSGRPRSVEGFDWRKNLQCIIRARTVVDNVSVCPPGERVAVLNTLLDMVCNVPPSHSFEGDTTSKNLVWVQALLKGGTFLEEVWTEPSDEERQLRARLHTYFGLTNLDSKPHRRVESRAYVYNFRNYRWDNEFGPFMMDGSGRVNWVHVKALHHTVSMQIDFVNTSFYAAFPMSLPNTQAWIPEGMDLDQERDWAGLSGLWKCSFSFCNHREILVYNDFTLPDTEPLDSSIFESPDFSEVFRSLNIEIRVLNTTADERHPCRPRIHFVGMMGNQTTMNGCVQMTPDNQIRWHFVSGEQGMAMWSSEGIQIGGVRSAFGVIGSWTTVFHERDDPVGPFWLHKLESR